MSLIARINVQKAENDGMFLKSLPWGGRNSALVSFLLLWRNAMATAMLTKESI